MKLGNMILATTGLFALSVVAHADDHRYQTSDVINVTGTGSFYQGAAWLIRSEEEVEGRIMTKVSTAGDPYTLWAVIFNTPSECAATPCAESDLGNPDVGSSVFYASSAISSANGGLKTNGKPAGGGVVNFDFELEGGSLPDGLFVLFGDPNGLSEGNGYGAEIHLVVDRHPPVPDGMSWVPDLTTTNLPGAGPATNNSVAIFLACPSAPCPGSVF